MSSSRIYLYLMNISVTVHNPRDDTSNFGRHINLQLTYSFQHQNSAKSPALYTPHGKFLK